MKTLCFATLVLLVGVLSVPAQFGRAGGTGMGGPPPGPGLSGSTAVLFGENDSFSASLEMQNGGGDSADTMTMPGKIFFDQGKSRFEMDTSQLKGSTMPPSAAAQMKSIGMDKMIMISRPDKKVGYMVYPGLQAFMENPLPEREASASTNDYKMEVTEMGKDTVDGHPCIKNKAVVTDKDGTQHQALVWNATDLKKFPIKIEQQEGNTKVTMSFRDISFSKPAADLFEPPSNSTKYDSMQSMMQQVIMKRMGGAGPKPSPGQ